MSSGFSKPYNGESFKAWGNDDPQREYIESLDKRYNSGLLGTGTYWCVTYFRVVNDKGYTFKGLGTEYYDNGLVGFFQCDFCGSLETAERFIGVKRGVSNNWYAGFGIAKVSIGETLDIEIVKPTEKSGCTGVITENNVYKYIA